MKTTSELVTVLGDLVRYTAKTNRNRACAWMSVLEERRAMLDEG